MSVRRIFSVRHIFILSIIMRLFNSFRHLTIKSNKLNFDILNFNGVRPDSLTRKDQGIQNPTVIKLLIFLIIYFDSL